MKEMAPGCILLKMYLKKRLKQFSGKTFLDVGGGGGDMSNLLLKRGFSGCGIDLSEEACLKNTALNRKFIENGRYAVKKGDFFQDEMNQKFDLVISTGVIEHFEEAYVDRFFKKGKKILNPNGRIVVIVPSNMKFWGPEDQFAGHLRRYSFEDFKQLSINYGMRIENLCGLTYPLSNILLPLSDFLISRQENYKKELDSDEKTLLSGTRNVKYKTHFPKVFRLILNEFVLYPFYVLQRIFKNHSDSMLIYCEMSPGEN